MDVEFHMSLDCVRKLTALSATIIIQKFVFHGEVICMVEMENYGFLQTVSGNILPCYTHRRPVFYTLFRGLCRIIKLTLKSLP